MATAKLRPGAARDTVILEDVNVLAISFLK
jgi:hypothetical protein